MSQALRTVLTYVALAAFAYVALCAAMFVFQRSMLYFPQPRSGGVGATMLTLAVDGVEVLVSTRPRPGPHAVIYFGGNAEDVSQTLPSLAAAFPRHALYLPHYRGYGGSGGSPSQDALFADALALVDHVRREHAEIVVIGRSLGSGVAVWVASRRTVARLVLVTPYDSIVGVAAVHYPWLPVRWLVRDRFESWRHAPAVGAPTLLIAAEHDEIIPRASTEALLTRFADGVATLEVLDGTSHNTIGGHPRYDALLAGHGRGSGLSSAHERGTGGPR